MPVGSKQWLLNVFDAWITQEIHPKTLDDTSLLFSNYFLLKLA